MVNNPKIDALRAALQLAVAYRETFLIATIKAEIKRLEKKYRAGLDWR